MLVRRKLESVVWFGGEMLHVFMKHIIHGKLTIPKASPRGTMVALCKGKASAKK